MIKLLRTAAASFLIAFVVLELLLRIIFSIKVGPDVLLYGTRFGLFNKEEKSWKTYTGKQGNHNVADHANKGDNYTKYYPNQKRKDTDKHGNSFDVTINAQGYRGNDFTKEKNKNTIRIITLGASSTFGYGDKDNETYPFLLQNMLNEYADTSSSKTSVQVYNMGIPHLTSSQILSIFQNETLHYNPDIITFYEGVNDCAGFNKEETLLHKAARRFVLLRLITEMRKQKDDYSHYDYERISPKVRENFLKNVNDMDSICRAKNIKFYFITQQTKSLLFPADTLRHMTYNEEQELVRKKMKTIRLPLFEFHFVLHGDMMNYVRQHAAPGMNIIEGISALDTVRNELTSWVHLSPRGNQILARAIADRMMTDRVIAGK